ncbi:hypothetical protein EK21DRAFT_75140 [Setomelanomma holmii]|uniref:Uncharacterized protein n=1 Tax=Setomelanomma holmii TaxID=210430 RepID=A0A9P4H1N4_9PLEO|nr:hypothetical protein EK21DRAFT_75140 [Setomelanomma holmii]
MVFTGEYNTYSLPYCSIKDWHSPFKSYSTDWWQYTTNGGGGLACTLMTANSTYSPRQTIKFRDMETLLLSFVILRAPQEWLELKAAWNETKPGATECALYPCANAYNTTTQNNVLHDDMSGSWAIRDPLSYMLTPNTINHADRAEAWNALEGSQLYEPIMDSEKEDLRLLIPSESRNRLQLPTRDVNFTHRSIRTLTESLLTFRGGEMQTQRTNASLMLFPDINARPMIDAPCNSTNLMTTFANVARSITNRARSVSGQYQQGNTQSWVVYVRVQWAYLAYPASMLVLGIAYVICMIVESTRLNMPVWKESALLTLMYGLNDETQRLLRDRECNEKGLAQDLRLRFAIDGKEIRMRLVAN